ncbi:hypothetical protein KA043_00030 [Candidatus Saccharibacteria bacterium]|nr:hypothetical protein [Candidatus Saccharibacteria bacterium]
MENLNTTESLYPEDYASPVPDTNISVDLKSIKEFTEATFSETVVIALSAIANLTQTTK